MSQQDITLALALGNFALTWGVALYMYLANKNKATNERIGVLETGINTRLREHDKTIAHLETTAKNAPSHSDLAEMYRSVNELAGTVNQLVGENKAQNHTLQLIHEYLLKGG